MKREERSNFATIVLAIGEIHESICAELLRWSTKYSLYVKTLIKNIVRYRRTII